MCVDGLFGSGAKILKTVLKFGDRVGMKVERKEKNRTWIVWHRDLLIIHCLNTLLWLQIVHDLDTNWLLGHKRRRNFLSGKSRLWKLSPSGIRGDHTLTT